MSLDYLNLSSAANSSLPIGTGITQELSSNQELKPTQHQAFTDRFYRECVDGSGVSASLYSASVRVVEDSGKWEPNRELGHAVATQWQFRQPHSYGVIAFFVQENGELWQGKPENPRTDKKGKTIKYEYPLGASVKPFLPAIDEATRQAIADRNGCIVPSDGDFWDWYKQHPEIPGIATEGGKKALALLSQGYVAIALVGVNGAVKKFDKINGEKVRRIKAELNPDLAKFAANGREITLAFDQDTAEKTVTNVERALDDLTFHLTQAGAKVRIAQWDGQNGRCKGIDDLIVSEGIQAWETAYSKAESADLWRIRRSIRIRVKRKADLNVGDEEFKAAADRIPTSGILALVGGKGTGKSTLIRMLLDKSWLSYSPLQSLARDQAGCWGGVFVNDGDRHKGTLLNQKGEPVLGGSVCWPSALSVSGIEAEILILDEVTASLQFLLGSKLANKDGIRPMLEEELIQRIQQAKLVILADADMTEETLRYIEAIRGERAFLVRSERKPLAWQGTFLDGTYNQSITDTYTAIKEVPDGKVLMLHTDSRALAESLADQLAGEGIKSLPITQKTSGGEIEREFLQSKGASLPQLVAMGIKAIICSPSVTIGFSIEQETHLIHQVWGIFSGVSISVDAIAQSLDRVRANIPRYIWAAKKGNASSKLSKATRMDAVLKDIESSSKTALRLARLSLKPDTLAKAESIDYGRENLKLLASFEAQRNRGMGALRLTLQALLEAEGKRVSFASCRASSEEAKVLSQALKELKKQAEIDRALRIENGLDITSDQADALKDKKPEDRTVEEQDALDKFLLKQFYRVEDINSDLVLWDKQGKRREQIRTLESILYPEIATEKTAQSIEHNPDSPQDWSKASMRQWLLEQTGAADFIRAIYEGNITELTEESCKPLAQKLKAHPSEFRKAFGVAAIDKQCTMQVMSWLLQSVGLTWTTHRRREDGCLTRVRKIDEVNLVRVKGFVNQRLQADPPPAINEENQGGGSLLNTVSSDDLADLLSLWDVALSFTEREAVLDAAIALNLPPNPELWRAA